MFCIKIFNSNQHFWLDGWLLLTDVQILRIVPDAKWLEHLDDGEFIPYVSVNSLELFRFTAQPSPHVVVGIFLGFTSKWTVPCLIPFKDAILKIDGYSGKIRLSPSWFMIWIVSKSIVLRMNSLHELFYLQHKYFSTIENSWGNNEWLTYSMIDCFIAN